MYRNILLDIPIRLFGFPQSPDCPLCVQSNTPDGVAFAAPVGRSFLHIRAGSSWRIYAPSGVCWGQCGFTMGDGERDRVNHDNLPARLLSVTDGSSRPAPLLSVITSSKTPVESISRWLRSSIHFLLWVRFTYSTESASLRMPL